MQKYTPVAMEFFSASGDVFMGAIGIRSHLQSHRVEQAYGSYTIYPAASLQVPLLVYF